MMPVSRRSFALSALAKPSLDETLRAAVERRQIPCAVAMVADADRILYQGAFGTRDPETRQPARVDSIFAIASMTKALTSIAALQLVEQGKVSLDEPAERHLPELRGRQVLAGFDAAGQARLRAPKRPVTLRHLLTHTSGLAYARWDAEIARWQTSPGGSATAPAPLAFDPGTRWQYGQGIDAAGRLVEALSGLTLEEYFQSRIFRPLGMADTSFILPAAKFERYVTRYARQPDGGLKPLERKLPDPPPSFNGGGGLFSTGPDYLRFTQAVLKRGAGLIAPATYKLLATNQIGRLRAGVLRTTDPPSSSDLDIHPGETDRHSLGWVVNPKPHRGGRSAGSFAWAGLFNTYYWIDPRRNRTGVLLMQYLPFADREAIGLLREFEQAVYAMG